MDEHTRLLAVHEIRQVKARYWLGVDLKDEALLASVFTDDAVIDFTSEREDAEAGGVLPSPAEFARRCVEMLRGVVTVHHGHNPVFTFESDSEAAVVWPMEDNLWVDRSQSALPFNHLQGYGFYQERYRKTGAGWKIAARASNGSRSCGDRGPQAALSVGSERNLSRGGERPWQPL